MAAGDFTASSSLTIQEMMEDIFRPGNQANAEFQRPVVSAAGLTREQTANVQELRDRISNQCIGFKVYWQKGSSDSPTYSGAISGDSLNCTITGTQLESDSKTYDANKHVRYNVAVSTNDCGNDIDANMRRAKAIQKAINNVRVGFNTACINFLDANKQDNQDSEVTSIDRGNGAWAVNADGKTIEIPQADLLDEKSLAFVDAVAQNNDIFDYFMVHGRYNWYELFHNAAYTRLNDDARNIFATFAARRHYFDIRYLDATLATDKNSFVVNPDSLVFINKIIYPNFDAQILSEKDGMWGFSIQDPVWRYNLNGTLVPVTYTVVMTRACSNRDSNGMPYFLENYEVSLKYDLATGPTGVNGETGIVKITGVAGV